MGCFFNNLFRKQERRDHIEHSDNRQELAPRKTLLAKDSFGKSYYILDCVIEGIAIYRLKKDGEHSNYYVLINGFMVSLGACFDMDAVLRYLKSINYDTYSALEKIFNGAIADPEKLAPEYFGKILGREDEAVTHNAPIIEKRRQLKLQKEQEHRRNEAYQKQLLENQLNNKLKEIEVFIISRQSFPNTMLQRKNLLLELFKKHNIQVPLRTQGWIKESLISVNFKDDDWEYSYDGNKSRVFLKYLVTSETIIKAAYAKSEATDG